MIGLYFNFWVSGGVFGMFKIRTFSQSVSGLLSVGFFEYMIRRHAFTDLTFSYNNFVTKFDTSRETQDATFVYQPSSSASLGFAGADALAASAFALASGSCFWLDCWKVSKLDDEEEGG